MLRVCRRLAGWGLLLLLLSACGFAGQSGQTTHLSGATATSGALAGSSGISLGVPTLPAANANPDPTAVHASPSAGHSGPPASSVSGQLAQQLFALINHDRAVQGLSLYILSSTLAAGARSHSVKMSSCGLSHQCPGEPNPCQRLTNEGIAWTSCGENVGYTSPYPTAWGGVQEIEKAMLAERAPDDGHRLNLLSTSFHRIGVGIYLDARGYVWITEDFAS
jgi:uncharacterized protein YkwD